MLSAIVEVLTKPSDVLGTIGGVLEVLAGLIIMIMVRVEMTEDAIKNPHSSTRKKIKAARETSVRMASKLKKTMSRHNILELGAEDIQEVDADGKPISAREAEMSLDATDFYAMRATAAIEEEKEAAAAPKGEETKEAIEAQNPDDEQRVCGGAFFADVDDSTYRV